MKEREEVVMIIKKKERQDPARSFWDQLICPERFPEFAFFALSPLFFSFFFFTFGGVLSRPLIKVCTKRKKRSLCFILLGQSIPNDVIFLKWIIDRHARLDQLGRSRGLRCFGLVFWCEFEDRSTNSHGASEI